MRGLSTLAELAAAEGDGGAWTADRAGAVVGVLVQQSLEKIDRTRAVAGRHN